MTSVMENNKPMNKADIHRLFESIILNRLGVPSGVKMLVEFFLRQGINLSLDSVLQFPFVRDLKRLEQWFSTLWYPKAPPITSDGLWFGIIEIGKGGFDLYAAVLPRHGREPAAWGWDEVKYPKPREAASRIFKTLLSPQGPIQDELARHYLRLGCAILIAQHLCHVLRPDLGAREPVVAAGYDEGEFFILGTARVNGRIEPLPKEESRRSRYILPKGNLFRLMDSGSPSRWLLDEPRDGNGRVVSRGFGLSGKPIGGDGQYDIPIYLKGVRDDFCFTLSGVPVVRRSVAEIIEQTDRNAIQRLPVTVGSVHSEYEILNVLTSVRPQKLLEQAKKEKTAPCNLDLGNRHIARARKALIVSRNLAESLNKAGVSGIFFAPLKISDLE